MTDQTIDVLELSDGESDADVISSNSKQQDDGNSDDSNSTGMNKDGSDDAANRRSTIHGPNKHTIAKKKSRKSPVEAEAAAAASTTVVDLTIDDESSGDDEDDKEDDVLELYSIYKDGNHDMECCVCESSGGGKDMLRLCLSYLY